MPNYLNNRESLAQVLWWLLCLNMWVFAIIGPIFSILGLLSFIVDIPGMSMQGEPVNTTHLKKVWTIYSLAFGVLGLSFAWLHYKGYLRLNLATGRPTREESRGPDNI